jgi:hypothetical protein
MINELCSADIIVSIKSRRMIRDGHVASLGEPRGACRDFMLKPEGKNNMEDVDVYDNNTEMDLEGGKEDMG